MARQFAQVGTNLWNEPSIRALTKDQQRAYFLVYTQPELSRCGVLPYRLKRLAQMSAGDTPTALRKDFKGLVKTRHLIVDEDSEELFIRTYVRHDGLLAQPQVVAAMVSDFSLIESQPIRLAFLTELRRIWDLDIPSNQRKGLRLALGEHETDRFRDKIGPGLSVELAAAFAAGSMPAFDPASPEGCPAPFAEPLARTIAPSPSPAPTPAPTPAPSAASAQVVATSRNSQPPATTDPPNTALTRPTETLALLDKTGPYVPKIRAALAGEVDELLAAGTDIGAVERALGVWRTRKAGPGLLAHLVQDELTPDQLQDPRFAGLLADAAASRRTG